METLNRELLQIVFGHVSTVVGLALGLLFVAHVLRQNYRPSVSIAWLLAIVTIPYLTIPLYILIGRRKFTRKARTKRSLYPEREYGPQDVPPRLSRTENVLITAGLPGTRYGNHVEFIDDGVVAYETLMKLIDESTDTIHIMTYILGRDDVGRAVVDALARKARDGVTVRLLLDGYGCLYTRFGFVEPLRVAGGHIGVFLPVIPLRRKWSANLRNHRKIMVFDGKVAVTGGMNIADEYIGPKACPSRWLDTETVVRGPATADLERIFCSDWNFATDEPVDPVHIEDFEERPEGLGAVQIAPSGPDVSGDHLHEALLSASYEARKRIWIVTPYFIPDEGLFRALMLQARVGRDVRLVVPAKSNHFLADLARRRMLRHLHHIGAKIYLYHEGMIHAKHVVFDYGIAATGSVNIDMRSLLVNYEVVMFMYSPEEVEMNARWMESLFGRCTRYEPRERGRLGEWAEDLGGLISPLL